MRVEKGDYYYDFYRKDRKHENISHSLFKYTFYLLNFTNTASFYKILTPLQTRVCLFRYLIFSSASFSLLKKLFLSKISLFLFCFFLLLVKSILKVTIMHNFICTFLVHYFQLMLQFLLFHHQASNLLFKLLLFLLQVLYLQLEVSYRYDVSFRLETLTTATVLILRGC
jgi:hypothetical protein